MAKADKANGGAAKGKAGAGKTGAGKLGGGKIPKRIAGVKLPKEIRRKGEALLAKAQSPAGRDAIAAGLTMVAAVAATTLRAKAERGAGAETNAATGQTDTRPAGAGGTTRGPDFEALALSAVGAMQTWLAGKKG